MDDKSEHLLSFKSIYRAYLDCRRRKRGTMNALRFEVNVMENLFDLAMELQKGRYRPSRSVCFITRSPKLREVFAADFRDRIVHHLVVRELEKVWEPRFIHDSYASRKGKGIHTAVERLQGFMRKVTRNSKRPGYFLQLDIRSFFMSIDKHILFGCFDQDPSMPDVLKDLLRVLIFHDPTKDYYFRGDRAMLERIPPHKSLFKVGPDKGLPIGNLTSQFFANVYLDVLDQFVKHDLGCRFYLRYVDDFILLDEAPDRLVAWRDRIAAFLDERLALGLKPGSRVKRVSEGADFLGYITRPNYTLVRNRVVNNMKYALAQMHEEMVAEVPLGASARRKGETDVIVRRLRTDPAQVHHLRQVIASYLGHFKHANSTRLVQNLWAKNPWLHRMFVLREGKLCVRSAPTEDFPNMREQVWFFRRHFPGFVLFFKVGRFVELYGSDARVLRGMARLRMAPWRRGLRDAVGFPLRMAGGVRRNLLRKGYRVGVVAPGEAGHRIRRRHVAELAMRVPALRAAQEGEMRMGVGGRGA